MSHIINEKKHRSVAAITKVDIVEINNALRAIDKKVVKLTESVIELSEKVNAKS